MVVKQIKKKVTILLRKDYFHWVNYIIEKKKINDQDYYFVKYEVIGKKSEEVIKNNLENIITAINCQKSMRWIHDSFKWARPINNILFYPLK